MMMMTNRGEELLSEFSSHSILSSVKKFLKAANNMNDIVMVPCRLLDMEVGNERKGVPDILKSGGDLYTYFTVVNGIRNEIMGFSSTEEDEEAQREAEQREDNGLTALLFEGHGRAPGSGVSSSYTTASNRSTASVTSGIGNTSDGEDSVDGVDSSSSSTSVDQEENVAEAEPSPAHIASTLRSYLGGLNSCLSHLTNAASYITDRYKEEVKI